MKIVFRVDASNRMGTGHLMRCLALATVLRDRGAETRFICRAHPGNLIELLQQQSMPVTVLPEPEKMPGRNSEDYGALLGIPQDEDAEQTIEALHGDRPDWLIIDHYGLDSDWEQRLRPHAAKLMVIDDLATRRHDCDLLLDQNYSEAGEERYRRLIPEACRLLLGPRYALLRPEYAAYRRILRHRNGKIRRVLVFFGGPDPYNMTSLALEALSAPEFRHLKVDVVVGDSNPHRAMLEKQTSVRPRTNLYGLRPHLADLMAQADLAIGAGGATTWERMCMRLPSIVISISENQRPACEALSKAGFINYAGDFRQFRASDLCDDIKKCVGSQDHSVELVIQGQLLVDGLGVLRVAELLVPTIAEKLRLRPASEHDMEFYFIWVNDPEVRRQSIESDPIPWEQHQNWFTNKLSDHQSYLFVLEAGSLPVGQIRFDKEGDDARIEYSLDSLIRRRGWAAHLVAMGAMYLKQSELVTLRAEVKADNHASRSVFLRLGFKQTSSTLRGEEYMSFHCHPVGLRKLDEPLPVRTVSKLDQG